MNYKFNNPTHSRYSQAIEILLLPGIMNMVLTNSKIYSTFLDSHD